MCIECTPCFRLEMFTVVRNGHHLWILRELLWCELHLFQKSAFMSTVQLAKLRFQPGNFCFRLGGESMDLSVNGALLSL